LSAASRLAMRSTSTSFTNKAIYPPSIGDILDLLPDRK
jgi:hypothetical protein